MRPIWQVDSKDVIGLQGRAEDFAQFINDLLSHQAAAGGLKDDALRRNLNTAAPDKGVDAAVDAAIVAQLDRTGYFGVPTCWQYKASSTANIKPSKGKKRSHEAALREEVRKAGVAKLIAAGYGYRYCVADDMPPTTKAEWEGWLLEEAQRIDPNAPRPKVLTAACLAGWASRLPGVVLPFRPFLGPFRSLRTWGSEITRETPQFVPVAAWQVSMAVIQEHADLNKLCVGVARVVHGEAGVGKTRCVYESLRARAENYAQLVYTESEVDAENIANILANDGRFCGIIVADECSVETRVRLERRLQPHAKRLRLVTIDNKQQDEPHGVGEIRLARIAEEEVERILEQRFPGLPPERLRAFVALSGGFVRLALELCSRADLVPEGGHVGEVLDFFRDHYLRARLQREDERRAVEAVALLPRVGYKGDVRCQLERLCTAVGLQPDSVLQTAARLKQAPGFIALGERYLYITPQVIAQAAFQSGWARWVAADPERFFVERLPAELLAGFAERIRACGTVEMRQAFFGFLQNWTSRLTAPDLADEPTVQWLVRLVEVEPQTLLPRLRRLIEATPVEELRKRHARDTGGDRDLERLQRSASGQAARRELVWLADKFLRLPEHFSDAERILLRLALAETEPYANNASAVWQELFRPWLSGTAIPFPERLQLLERRFQTTLPEQLTLCLGALRGLLTSDGPALARPLGPPVVAGRIPPPDWRPRNAREERECWTLTVGLLKRLAQSENAALRDGILGVVIRGLANLLCSGFLPDVIEVVGPAPLPDARLAELLRELDQFLQVFCAPSIKQLSPEAEAAVRDWRRRLVPDSLHGRLVSVIGQEPWQLGGPNEDHAEETIATLARDLLHDPAAFERELPWLCSREARSAPRLGALLGQLDAGGGHLDRVVEAAASSRYRGIATGYLRGLVEHHPDQIDRVNSLLDRLQPADPRTVFELTSAGPRALRPLERLLAMTDAGLLPVEFLRGAEQAKGNQPLTSEELRQALDRLMAAARRDDEAAARAAVYVLWRALCPQARPAPRGPHSGPWLEPLLEAVLDVTLPAVGSEAFAWADLLEVLGEVAFEAAVRLAIRALASANLQLHQRAQAYLAAVAPRHPEPVMRHLGEALLNPALGWRLAVHQLRDLVAALPVEVVRRWLDAHGEAAARALARHLPPPHLDPAGNPVVPELTAHVLERFADDDRVFQAFCTGTHSGEWHWGDITARHDGDGEIARRFLDHPLPRIQDWAQHEIDQAAHQASWARARDEEMTAP
jgi:hypothetical protein